MNLSMIPLILISTIVSAGGVGAIVLAVVRFSSDFIADRMMKKYEAKLSKELEAYKSELDKHQYVSKTRFDTEFLLYKELSSKFYEMVKAAHQLVPPGFVERPADADLRKKQDKVFYDTLVSTTVDAQDALYKNEPFLSEEFLFEYEDLIKMARLQQLAYSKRFNVLNTASNEEKESFTPEDYDRSGMMSGKLGILNKKIRDHIRSMEIIG